MCCLYLTTVLFVSESNGITHSAIEYGVWIIIATKAAVGNAVSRWAASFFPVLFFASLNVPLNIMWNHPTFLHFN